MTQIWLADVMNTELVYSDVLVHINIHKWDRICENRIMLYFEYEHMQVYHPQ